MKTSIELLIPDLQEGAISRLKGELADILAGHGLTTAISTYTPESATLSALDAVTGGSFDSGEGTFTRPAAAIRVYTAS